MKNVLLSLLFIVCLLGALGSATAQDTKSTGEAHTSGQVTYSSAKVQDDDDGGDVSELTLSKTFKGESVGTSKKFNVGTNYTMLKFLLRGKVTAGVISITLLKPNGEKFKTIEIDATSDVNFEQTLDLEKKPAEWTGDWQIKIQTDKAEGFYNLRIYTC